MSNANSVVEDIKGCQVFKEHVVRDFSDTHITWTKPSSSYYWARFIINAGWLIVLGDTGEAIYQWSEPLTWDFLEGLNFSYFHSKCVASDKGRVPYDWDRGVADERLKEMELSTEQYKNAFNVLILNTSGAIFYVRMGTRCLGLTGGTAYRA